MIDLRRLVDDDLKAGLRIGLCVGLALLALVPFWQERGTPAPGLRSPPSLSSPLPQRRLELRGEPASPDARRLARWIVETGDNGGRTFVLLDKRDAKVFVFEPDGRLVAATPVLLGFAVGDDTVPGIAAKALSEIHPGERTTPAGRFLSQSGRNAQHEEVVWVDYSAAVSMHRVRTVHAGEHRLERLASPTVADNRISFGCINMPVAFFDDVVWPRLGGGRQGVVYVLPETRPLAAVFPAVEAATR